MAKPVARVVEPFDYILPSDEKLPPDEQSIFTFRPMAQKERLAVLDNNSTLTYDGEGNRHLTERAFRQGYDIVMSHLVKVQNFPPGAAEPWPDSKEKREKYLEQMSDVDILLLGSAVMNKSILQPAEKNS